jgi:uncharacterized protein (TIGR02145 family)
LISSNQITMKNIFFVFLFFLIGIFAFAQKDIVTDIDGNEYKTVTIGNQVWMAENLRVTHYRNGDLIHNILTTSEWDNLKSGACCDYNNTPGNSKIFGKLYNWYAVNDIRNIAPVGWHIPTQKEWNVLITYLGGENVAGGRLKECGIIHWFSPNSGATNESGFTALPGGSRYFLGRFFQINSICYWWSSTQFSDDYSYTISLSYDSSGLGFYNVLLKNAGLSVRCVKD